jgi:hypothetical protein
LFLIVIMFMPRGIVPFFTDRTKRSAALKVAEANNQLAGAGAGSAQS